MENQSPSTQNQQTQPNGNQPQGNQLPPNHSIPPKAPTPPPMTTIPSTKKCSECHQEIPKSDKICPICGKKQTDKRKTPLLIAAGVLTFFIIMGALASGTGENSQEYKTLKSDYTGLQSDYDKLKTDYDEINTSFTALETENKKVVAEYADYKETMKPYEEMSAAEAEAEKVEAEQKVAAEKKAKEEAEAAEKKAAEEKAAAEQAAAEAEAAKGYETGITYDQLARTPDDFLAQKIKFYGKVIQVIEGTSEIQIRLAVNDDYDTVLLCGYNPDIVTSRVLEDDEITIYGTSLGLYSYESTMGGTITIPSVYIDKIE